MTTAAAAYAERPLWRSWHSFWLGVSLLAISPAGYVTKTALVAAPPDA
jgi:hypothetical protein